MGLARGSGGSRSQRSRVLHAIHCAAASPRPSKPRAWFADTRISLCASLRLPARRLLRARREAHPIGDRIEAPVQARQRCRRCPPEPSTRCRTLRNPFCAHAAGRSFHSAVRVSPSCRARDISLSTSRRTSTPHAIPTVHNPHSRCSRSSPRTPHWRSSRGPGGQDWSPCAASVVICGGHFLLPIHVSHSTASRGGTSEPQRVPTRPPASRSGGVSLLIRYHVEQGRGRALFGLGPPSRPHLCGACTKSSPSHEAN